jgi:hypothetical protein
MTNRKRAKHFARYVVRAMGRHSVVLTPMTDGQDYVCTVQLYDAEGQLTASATLARAHLIDLSTAVNQALASLITEEPMPKASESMTLSPGKVDIITQALADGRALAVRQGDRHVRSSIDLAAKAMGGVAVRV